MYAIMQTGGKQYRVAEGDTVRVEKLDAEAGVAVRFTDVRLIGAGADVRIGAPQVDGASVLAGVRSQGLGEKVIVFKHKRRKGYRRRNGHRQPYTEVRITGIEAGA